MSKPTKDTTKTTHTREGKAKGKVESIAKATKAANTAKAETARKSAKGAKSAKTAKSDKAAKGAALSKAAGTSSTSNKGRKAGKDGSAPSRDTAQARIDGISAERVATAPSKPVKVAILEAERLDASIGKYRKTILALPGFRGADIELLPELVKTLERSERAWGKIKAKQGATSLQEIRRDAEAWRSETMAVARYLLRRDVEATTELERIAEGEGLPDLIQDIDDLVYLVSDHSSVFETLETPIDTEAAMALAKALRKGRDDDEAVDALNERNRAFWALDDVVDEIRSALRFVLRNQPKKLTPFLSRYEAARRSRRRRSSTSNGAGPKPVVTPPEA